MGLLQCFMVLQKIDKWMVGTFVKCMYMNRLSESNELFCLSVCLTELIRLLYRLG